MEDLPKEEGVPKQQNEGIPANEKYQRLTGMMFVLAGILLHAFVIYSICSLIILADPFKPGDVITPLVFLGLGFLAYRKGKIAAGLLAYLGLQGLYALREPVLEIYKILTGETALFDLNDTEYFTLMTSVFVLFLLHLALTGLLGIVRWKHLKMWI